MVLTPLSTIFVLYRGCRFSGAWLQ